MRLFLLPISSKHTFIYAQRINRQLAKKKTLVERITTRASEQWLKWESYEKGWQKKVTEVGNKAFARIPYQEWGLKSIPPLSTRRRDEELEGGKSVDVYFPPAIIKPETVPVLLRRLATERQAFHKKWMWYSIIGTPFTVPFALVPM
jgi:hypothetical protein